MGRLSACCLALALCAGPASACINDAELPDHEREFRSQYNEQPTPLPPPEPSYSPRDYWPAVGGGLALLFSGAAVAVFGGRSRG